LQLRGLRFEESRGVGSTIPPEGWFHLGGGYGRESLHLEVFGSIGALYQRGEGVAKVGKKEG
jgi:hypothetical protein